MSSMLAAEKKAMRAEMAERRAAAYRAPDAAAKTRDACHRVAALLEDALGSDLTEVVLSGYMPMRSELDPMPAMSAHLGPVCVPVILGKGQPLEFHHWHRDAEMVEGAFKALIPRERAPMRPRAMLVPLLAFDRHGYRLGYGGGFYDRTLEALRAEGPVLAIGFAFEVQEVAQVPTEVTDQKLDAIITPSEMIRP